MLAHTAIWRWDEVRLSPLSWREPRSGWELDDILNLVASLSGGLSDIDSAMALTDRILPKWSLLEMDRLEMDADGALRPRDTTRIDGELLAWVVESLWGRPGTLDELLSGWTLARVREDGAIGQVCVPLISESPGIALIACSLSGDFVGTTNFELVRNADAIVVAEAVSASQTEDAGTVEYRVLEVIKGDPPDRVHNDFANFGTAVPSRPMTFIGANPDSAGCVRTAFEPGGKYVLFLNAESDQRYVVRRDTHARIAEDYDGPDSYWVRAIRYYMSAQDGRDQMEQLAFLETEVQRLSQFEDQSFERILQLDIADHLSTLSMAKSTDYLVRVFEGAYGGKIFPDFGNLPGPEGSETINQILGLAPLFDDDTQTDLNDRMKTRALNALSRRSDARVASFFTQRVYGGSQDPELLGAAIRFFVRFGELEKARMLAEQHAFVVLNLAPQDGAARFHS